MKKRVRRLTIFLTAFFFLPLSGCNMFGLFPTKGQGSYLPPDGKLHKAEDSEIGAYEVALSKKRSAIPSSGSINTLVIPVEFSDFPFSSLDLEELEIAFNGTGEETRYFESVKSFYEKSSFNSLSLEAEIAPIYEAGTTREYLVNENSSRGQHILNRAILEYSRSHDISKFDNDNDGYIDAVYLIYSAPYYSSSEGMEANLSEDFWAFTYWIRKGELSGATYNAYVFASIDFLHRGTLSGIDAHTYIHETGHLLGLNDYYNYDQVENNAATSLDYRYYSPLGGLDMMDFNILDHNVYSKWLLGWNSPYVLDHNVELPLTISLESSSKEGAFLAIPSRNHDYNGTPFDEYILVEVYEPTGLNYLDSYQSYINYPRGYSVPGVKIYHVDARLFKRSLSTYMGPIANPTLEDLEAEYNSTVRTYFAIGASNTPSEAKRYGLKEGDFEIHLIESSGEVSFSKGSQTDFISGTNDTLFSDIEGRDVFNIKKYRDFFVNSIYLNSLEEFGYNIKINGFSKDEDGTLAASITLSEDI